MLPVVTAVLGLFLCGNALAAATDPYRDVNIIGGRKLVMKDFDKFPRWVRIMPAFDFTAARETPQLRPWIRWAQTLRSLPPHERLQAINSRVNKQIAYRTDVALWGQRDYWELPAETALRTAADCEGFAIFKNYLAAQAGVPASDMLLLIGTITSTREAHAVLIADANGIDASGSIFVLDNRLSQMVDIETARDLSALYSLDLAKAMIFLQRR